MSDTTSRLDEVSRSELKRILASDDSLHEGMVRLFRRKEETFLVATPAR